MQNYVVLTTLALSEPKNLPQGKVYGLLRFEKAFITEVDAKAHQKKLAEERPKEVFLVAQTGKYVPFVSDPIKFSMDTTTITGNSLREGSFIPDSEAQKALRQKEQEIIREIKETHENLKEEDERTETEGTVENYIKKRVVTTVLFDTVRSLTEKLAEAQEKLDKTIVRLLDSETPEIVENWLEVYNKKRKSSGNSEFRDGISFINWLNEQREKRGSTIREQ